MAVLSNHVSLTITQDSVGIARAGFGVPLFLSANATWTERTRSYNSLSDVAADFPHTGSPEYLFAQALFSQKPCPKVAKIGRQALKPTIAYTLVPTAQNTHVYTLTLGGDGVTTTQVSYTSDGSATAAEIVAGLTTAINAISSKNFTATGSTTLIVTANAAGSWFWLQTDKIADWSANACAHSDPGVATDLAAIANEDNDWYCLLTADPGNASVLAACAWVESNKKITLAEVAELQTVTTVVTNSDTLDDLHTLGYARTAGCYHPSPQYMFSSAWAGKVLPSDPGSESWKFHTLAGIPTTSLTATQRTNLIAREANSVETVAGRKITFEGTTTDGDFIDVQRGLDWIEDDMSKGVFGALVSAAAAGGKIPLTDDGIAVIEAQVRATLRRAVKRGILSSSPAPTVTVPLASEISDADKAARRLPDVKFTGTLAGAIHKVVLTGVVSV